APTMNELTPPPDVTRTRGFGAALCAARERRGLTIGDIASRLHLHPRQVRALEAGDIAALPRAPYARGFLRNYARELDLDAAPLLADYDARAAATAAAEEPAAASEPGAPVRVRVSGDGGRRFVLIGAVAVLVVLALIGTLAGRRGDRPGVARDLATVRDTANPPRVPGAGSTAGDAAPVSTPSAGTAGADATEVPAPAVAAAAPGAGPAVAAAGIEAPGAHAPPAAGLVLKFRGASWVQVVEQRDGRVLLSRLDVAGAEEELPATAPLSLTIGNAPMVTVEYRGKPVDLAPYTGAGSVARFNLP
ncbi:MAG TPA: helix-turn-helix domain-containing protein, partial [Burkholderiaceae bacterium]|nr:helix-turn-helix domain-containing protein [Burkholderiaceae bacterium]